MALMERRQADRRGGDRRAEVRISGIVDFALTLEYDDAEPVGEVAEWAQAQIDGAALAVAEVLRGRGVTLVVRQSGFGLLTVGASAVAGDFVAWERELGGGA